MDYAFMTAEDVGEDMCPVLVGYDNDSHGIWALAVDAKGATKSSVQWVTGKIDEAGCSGTPIILRSDQEEAIMAPKRHVAVYRKLKLTFWNRRSETRRPMVQPSEPPDHGRDNSGQSDITLKGGLRRRYRRIWH